MDRKKIIYIGIMIIITVFASVTYFSYAFFASREELPGRLNIVAGTLDYKIESNDLNNNSITLEANESKQIELTITSLNTIDSEYELYYEDTSDIEVGYLTDNDTPTGEITSNGTKTVSVVIKNNSNTSKIVTFGVQGGFVNKELVLATNRNSLIESAGLCNIEPGTVYTFDYTGTYEEFEVPCDGIYQVELWGARGAGNNKTSTTDYGGLGAYTSGIININKNQKFYVYVGQAGIDTTGTATKTFNGGGYSKDLSSVNYDYGGGATDIRVVNGTWNNSDSLRSRIMVAAGGAATSVTVGGAAGGLTGYQGGTGESSYIVGGAGGTQTAGGNGGVSGTVHQSGHGNGSSGIFGEGGNASTNGGGGGSGWYGGGGGSTASNDTGGGGGSSYISGHTGCVAVTSTSSSNPKSECTTGTTDNSCSISPYGYTFTNTKMIDGAGYGWSNVKGTQELMPNPSGGYYASGTGHTGNGYAKITYLGQNKTVTFNAGDGTVSEATRTILEGNAIGSLPTPTKTNYVFKGWYLENTFDTKIDSTYIVNSDITLYAKLVPTKTYLYNNGTISPEVGSFIIRKGHGYGEDSEYSSYNTSASLESSYIFLRSGTGSTNNVGIGVVSNNEIDISDYDKLCVNVKYVNSDCNLKYGKFQYGISSTNTVEYSQSNNGTYNYYLNKIDNYAGVITYSQGSGCLDISEYNDSYYLILHNYYNGTSYVYSVWLSNE